MTLATLSSVKDDDDYDDEMIIMSRKIFTNDEMIKNTCLYYASSVTLASWATKVGRGGGSKLQFADRLL